MRRLYAFFLYLATPLLLAYFILRGLRDRRYWRRWRERLGRGPAHHSPGRIMVHGSSLGEVNAAAPLVRALLNQPGIPGLLFTTFTPTGSQRVSKLFGQQVEHCYLPLDLPFCIRRFLARQQPSLMVIMETEVWPNLIHFAHRQSIPVVIANARLSEKSLHGYRRLGALIRPSLGAVDRVLAQNAADGARFIQCGANPGHVVVTGNLKFDIDLPGGLKEAADRLRAEWGPSRPVLVAGSTHADDEAVILAAFSEVVARFPAALLVLAPRHPERFSEAARSARAAGLSTQLLSDGAVVTAETRCLVVDAMGELLRFYAAADVAFVGGTLADRGGHNPLEPAALARPVLLGPHTRNVEATAARLVHAGGARRVHDAGSMATALIGLFGEGAERERMGQANLRLIAGSGGALDRTLAELDSLLPAAAFSPKSG